MTVTLPVPFCSSRLLAQNDPLLGGRGVALDIVGVELEDTLDAGWRRRVQRVAARLGWPAPRFVIGRGENGSTLGFTAPCDQLLTAREANEWAICAALLERDPGHWGALREALRDGTIAAARTDSTRPNPAKSIEERAALAHLQRIGCDEARQDQSSR